MLHVADVDDACFPMKRAIGVPFASQGPQGVSSESSQHVGVPQAGTKHSDETSSNFIVKRRVNVHACFGKHGQERVEIGPAKACSPCIVIK